MEYTCTNKVSYFKDFLEESLNMKYLRNREESLYISVYKMIHMYINLRFE